MMRVPVEQVPGYERFLSEHRRIVDAYGVASSVFALVVLLVCFFGGFILGVFPWGVPVLTEWVCASSWRWWGVASGFLLVSCVSLAVVWGAWEARYE